MEAIVFLAQRLFFVFLSLTLSAMLTLVPLGLLLYILKTQKGKISVNNSRYNWGYWTKSSGNAGERRVEHILNQLNDDDYKILNDLLIPISGGYSQIDHVVISSRGIFVIETKNYSGWIFGDSHKEYWTQTFKTNKYKFKNPVRQNYGHIQALKAHLGGFPDEYLKSLVVFVGDAEFKTPLPEGVIYGKRLISEIEKPGFHVISPENREILFTYLQMQNDSSDDSRKKHIKNIQDSIFSKEKKIADGFCPLCDGKLTKRSGQFGFFSACENYPNCNFRTSD